MALETVILPCLQDNYAYLLHDTEIGQTVLIDAPEAAPIQNALKARGWGLTHILLTHHHDDHIQGVDTLRHAFGAQVIGAKADAHRLPALDVAVTAGDRFDLLGGPVAVIDVPGHTIGHIAFYMPHLGAVFTADSLMAMGCGRLFEGTPDQMWQSLSRLMALPPETKVYSGHEYTQSNARFALSVDGDNPDLRTRAAEIDQLRADGLPTLPSTIALELATNPFLRAAQPGMKAALGMEGATDAQVFAELRARKDSF